MGSMHTQTRFPREGFCGGTCLGPKFRTRLDVIDLPLIDRMAYWKIPPAKGMPRACMYISVF